MKRLMGLVAALSIIAVGCGAGADGTETPTVEATATTNAATPTPTPSQTPMPTPVPTTVSVTWDGTTCDYRGPAVFPREAPVLWMFSTIGAAMTNGGSAEVLLLVGPVKAGTSWDDVREAEKIPASQWPPPFADLSLGYELTASPGSLSMLMVGDEYYVGCGTSPTSGDRYTAADLVYVIDR